MVVVGWVVVVVVGGVVVEDEVGSWDEGVQADTNRATSTTMIRPADRWMGSPCHTPSMVAGARDCGVPIRWLR